MFILLKKYLGSVYSARSPDDGNVAVKVIDLNKMPAARAALVDSYLNEVRHLEKLRRVTHHVVAIYDFDFDPRQGRGKFDILYINI